MMMSLTTTTKTTTTTKRSLSLLLFFLVGSILPHHRCEGWFVENNLLPASTHRSATRRKEPLSSFCQIHLCSKHNDNNQRPTKGVVPKKCSTSVLYAHNNNNNNRNDDDAFLQSVLKEYGYDKRIITLSQSNLPVLAEFQQDGQAQICWIQNIVLNDSHKTTKLQIPKLDLKLPDGSSQIVDIGQMTTIWVEQHDDYVHDLQQKESHVVLKQITANIDSVEETSWPVGHIESTLDQLWQRRSRVIPSSNSGLSKKQVTKLIETSCPSGTDEYIKSNADQVLRQVIKAGNFYSRLVDSEDVRWACFQNQQSKTRRGVVTKLLRRRAYSSKILGTDANVGGRFKRFGCIPLMNLPSSDSMVGQQQQQQHQQISLINGGWLALDQSVRATSEARKFSERILSSNNNIGKSSSSKNIDSDDVMTTTTTIADERIIHRLECLAMEETASSSFERGGINFIDDDDEKSLELDVRQTLKAMNLPTTSKGAKQALIRIGRWTESSSNSDPTTSRRQTGIQAWPQSVLAAAEWYRNMDKQRRRRLYNSVASIVEGDGYRKIKNNELFLEGRVDLTKFPSICIDAARAKFRDDAMSVRPRASTGRKVNPKASKWEILLHISDVSDIYATKKTEVDDPDGHLKLLRKAAAGRAVSRYDLPSGPLHLLPPIALEALALQTINPDLTSKSNVIQSNHHHRISSSVNRCVTLWVYIDERSGKILDAGIERSIISCPLALSFDSATRLLDEPPEKGMDPILKKARAVFGIVERNVDLWKQYHTTRNEASQAREKRLAAREVVGRATYGNGSSRRRDDGREGFVRTRGHQTVDACLELYGYAIQGFLHRKKASLPRVAGTGPDRLGRVATAPLRRFIDGIAQQQALAVICGYGGDSLTKQQCIEIGKETTKVINSINNLDSRKQSGTRKRRLSHHERNAIRTLKNRLSAVGKSVVPAMGTGRQNEVVILGVGTVASCSGVRGTLKPGEKVMVRLTKVDEDRGVVSVALV